MKRIIVTVLGVAAMAFIITNCGGGLTTSSGKTLASVNGKKITEGDVEFLGKINPRITAQLASPAGKKRILDNLVEQELLYQEAVKKGINRDPDVRAKADLYRRVIVAQSLLDKQLKEEGKKYYDEHPEEFQKLGLSHIVIQYQTAGNKKGRRGEKVHSEKEALNIATKIKERIDKGESFNEVAKAVSEDASTKNRGGDMGLVAKDDPRFKARGYAPLVDKAFTMKVGEVAGPIKTEKGYHVITVTRGIELEPFDEAERSILFKVKGTIRNDLLAKLKKEGSVTYAEELTPKPAATEKPAELEKAQESQPAEQKEETKGDVPQEKAK